MRLIDADALIEKFNEKASTAEALMDETTAERFRIFCLLADAVEQMPTVDAVPVVHGRWIFPSKHLRCRGKNRDIDERRLDAKLRIVPTYYCSECAETSRDAHEKYCSSCGAKMDGGKI